MGFCEMLCAGKVAVCPETKACPRYFTDVIKEGSSKASTAKVRMYDEFSAGTFYLIGEIEMCIASNRSLATYFIGDDDVAIILISAVTKMKEDVFRYRWDAIVTSRLGKEFEHFAKDLGIGRLKSLHES